MIRHALVLTAGLGTRLRPLTDVRAKPAIPVAGDAMARRILRWLAASGVTDVVMNLHHLPETLTAVVGDGSDLGIHVRYSWEHPEILGSAGGPRLALPLIGADTFLLVNGDTLTDMDLEGIESAHARSGALATLALVPNREFTRYGGVRLDAERRVTGFVPRGPAADGSYHFIGIQVVHASAFASVARGSAASTIGGVYDRLIRERPGSVSAFVCDAAFHDVGTPADYWRTSLAFGAANAAGSTVGRASRIDASASVVRSILWDDVTVEADASIVECIVTDRVTIPAGASFERTILTAARDGALASTPLTI